MKPEYQQRGFPLRKYFIPGCAGRDLDLDLRVRRRHWRRRRLEMREFGPFGIEDKKKGFQPVRDGRVQKFQGLGLKLQAFVLTLPDVDCHLFWSLAFPF